MNKNFENILNHNKSFIETINKIYVDIIKKENNILSQIKQVLNPVDILSNVRNELKSKKYENIIDEIIYIPELHFNKKIIIIDKNRQNWTFDLINNVLNLKEVYKIYSGSENLKNINEWFVVNHKDYISTIFQNTVNEDLLLDISDRDLKKEDCDLLFMTKDIDLNFLLNHKIELMLLPKKNNIGIEDIYKKNDNKKSILSKVFNF